MGGGSRCREGVETVTFLGRMLNVWCMSWPLFCYVISIDENDLDIYCNRSHCDNTSVKG